MKSTFRFPPLLIAAMFLLSVTSCKKAGDPVPVTVTAGFTFTSKGSFPVIASFVNTSSGNYVQWTWDFGDGTSSTLVNPLHGYGAPGTYNVRLIATTATGVTDTVMMSLLIPAELTGPAGTSARNASFVYHLYWSAPFTVTYTNTSANAVSYVWDFGDGSTSVSASSPFNHSYPVPGTYQVQLRSTGAAGTDTARATIIFN